MDGMNTFKSTAPSLLPLPPRNAPGAGGGERALRLLRQCSGVIAGWRVNGSHAISPENGKMF